MGNIVEPIERDIDDPVPFLATHAGESGVIMNAGVVDQDLHRCLFQKRFQRRPRRCCIGDVENHGLRRTAGRNDVADHGFGGGNAPIRMHIYEMACSRELSANGRADTAAATGDQGAWRCLTHGGSRPLASRITDARPISSRITPDLNSNSYSAVPPSPATRTALQIRSPRTSSRRNT